MSESHVEETY